MVAEFRRRRDLVVDGLNTLPGVRCARPRGAFYVFPNITGTGRPSAEVAERLLTEAGVAALSGTAFGEYGEGYLRLSYANSEANLREALDAHAPVLVASSAERADPARSAAPARASVHAGPRCRVMPRSMRR